MPLPAGSRIGAFEVTDKLGEGGMGEVYRALDTRLRRIVAVKVLPASFKQDPDRLARFRREAELLAALNHPNIAHVYGVEEAGGEHALVMELAEGSTLAERIAPGPIALDEALSIARQVLEALAAAHERGIVHRDLKPANIKVSLDGIVKVLDFGLAKSADRSSPIGLDAGAISPDIATITSPALTAMGLVLGTAAYMAPEQARGRAVDGRADLWAFGCVLYEMLTGRRAFGGDDITETLANVLTLDVDLRELPPAAPPRVRTVIGACLQKDPRRRLSSAQDARLALDGVFETGGTASATPIAAAVPLWRRGAPYGAVALAGALVIAIAAWRLVPAPDAAIVSRFDYDLPEGVALRNIGRAIVAISPDGRSIVYNAAEGLRVKRMEDLDARIIPGTEASLANPFFSPDSRHVAFFTSRTIVRMPLAGGAPTAIVKDLESPNGAHWTADDTILLALRGGIARVPATGGAPQIVVPAAQNEQMALPQLLPGGDAVLFTVAQGRTAGEVDWDRARIAVHSIAAGRRTAVIENARDGRYLPTGHLVYAVEDGLFAAPFDPATLTVTGAAAPLLEGVWWQGAPAANWSVSTNGTLAYVPNIPTDALHPVWVTRDGGVAALPAIPGGQTPRLSPDGKRALLELDGDVWIYDLDTGRRTRVTSDGASGRPAWHPAGTQVAYSSSRSGSEEVWVAPIDGTGAPRKLTDLPGAAHVDSWSPDGRTLAFHHHRPGEDPNEILTITPDDASPAPQKLGHGEFNAESAVFSPDGRYIAFISAETGRREIVVRPFPGRGPDAPVSIDGGREPVWSRTGDLFYRSATGDRMLVAKVTTSPSLVVGAPTELFTGPYFVLPRNGSPRPQYDVTADGRRLLMLQVSRTARPQIVVVQNWFEELRALK